MKNTLLAIGLFSLLFSACSKKMPVALPGTTHSQTIPTETLSNPNYNNSANTSSIDETISPAPQNKSSFQRGAVNENGKYTGSDGVSRSGIKLLYFASDSYTLDEDQIQRLMSDIPKVKNLVAEGKIIVEGNCDEFGTDEYNHALGLKRAKAVKKLLVSAGIPSEKIDTVSYGESNPVCTINEPACHAKNRRAEINKI
jgi:peptidoglycan-associated lipoprotein